MSPFAVFARSGLFVWFVVFGLSTSAPVRAEEYGGIELGARGVKAVVLDITVKPEGNEIKVLFSGSENVGLAELGENDQLDPKRVTAAAAAVKKFTEMMAEKYHLKPERISVVGSSGLFSTIAKKPEAILVNQKCLAEAVSKESSLSMSFIDATREATLTIDAVIPAKYLDSAMSLDIGGGNTKGGYRSAPGKYSTFQTDFGTSTFHDAAKKAGGDFMKQVGELRESLLTPAFKTTLGKNPEFSAKKRVYLSGGIVWATAMLVHPADRSAYTMFTPADFDAVETLLKKSPDFPVLELSGIEDAATKASVEKEIAQLKKVYTRDQLLAGVQILKVLAKELDLVGAEKKLAFVRNAQTGWISAYIIEKAGERK